MTEKQTFHIAIDKDNKTALEYLHEESGLSKQKIKRYMQQGCVWLEHKSNKDSHEAINSKTSNYVQRLRRAKKVLSKGEQLYFYYDPKVLHSEPPVAQLVEDFGNYSIWNKPSGMLSQGSKWGDHFTINRWAEKQLVPERPAFIVHRLDRAANGLIILAHKKQVASLFSRMFERRNIEKYYLVSVNNDFSSQITTEQARLTIDSDIDGKTAVSHVQFLSYDLEENVSQLKVNIETGRKHQIRKHLSGVGFPVVGDRLYSDAETNFSDDLNLKLQAQSLKFNCPVENICRKFTL